MSETAKTSGTKRLVPRLRFPEFHADREWSATNLGAVCDVLQGYGFPLAMQGKDHGMYPFCKVSDISRAVDSYGGLLSGAANYVDDADVRALRAHPLPAGTTVFAKIGEALRLNRRALTTVRCLVDNNATGIKAKASRSSDYFVFVLSQLVDMNLYCGGAVPSISKSTLESIPVAVPSAEEQQKIADCLSSLDDLITAHADKLAALKQHKQGLLEQLFPREGETVPRLRFPEFRNSDGWSSQALGTLTTKVGSGITPRGGSNNYRHSGRMFVRSQNVGWGTLLLDDVVYIDEAVHDTFRSTEIMPMDVLLNISGASIGRSAVADERVAGGNVNQHVCLIRTKSKLRPVFLDQFLLSHDGQRQIDSFQAGGNRQGLNYDQIRSFSIPLPPTQAEQQKIATCLSTLDALITAQSDRLAALKQHKQGLLQQLFPVMDEAAA